MLSYSRVPCSSFVSSRIENAVMSSIEVMSQEVSGVFPVDPLRDERWPDFVDNHSCASVFHSRGWLSALKAAYGYEPIAFTTTNPSEPLTNALVFCAIRSWLTGRRLVSLPFSDHCEPLVESSEQFQALCVYVETLRLRERWKYVEMRSADVRTDFAGHFYPAQKYQLHQLDLRPSLDALFKKFHKDCIQRKITKAERESVTYEAGRSTQLLHQLYRLLLLTRSRHKVPPQPLEWFRQLMVCMGKDVCIRIASKDGRPIAGIMTLDHGRTMVYKYGGSDARFNNLGATPLLFWRAIKEAKDAGMQQLDLGRSGQDNPGLITFKERWSAQSFSLTNWRAPAASLTLEKTKVRLAKEICARLPDALSALAGRFLYRHIG